MDRTPSYVESIETENVVLRIENLTVWTPEEKSWWRRKAVKPKTVILNNISACIKEGELAAVLGPSGAGKTTLLVALAGKCTLPMLGRVLVGGRDVTKTPGAVEILPQFDVFVEFLNVLEHLIFMTELKLGSTRKPHIREILDSLVQELRLKAHARTRISSLSGGERRLLSLATSLLSSPDILICDEPTTGLDSYNAALVVGTLKRLALAGKVVICSVHQPSTDLFKEFNTVLLMTEGRLLFHGVQEDCKALFESINLRCPQNYNPAEFYIRAVSRLGGASDVDKLVESYQDRLTHSGTDSEADVARAQITVLLAGRAGPQLRMNSLVVNFVLVTFISGPQDAAFIRCRRNWFKQVQLLLWRSSLTIRRDIKGQIFQLLFNVLISSMIIGTCYVGVSGTTQRGIQDIRGLLWLMTSEVSFALSYSALYAFEAELPLFKREVGIYSCSSYLVARFLGFVPNCVLWPTTLVFITTLAVDLPNHFVTALEFLVTLWVVSLGALAYGLGMAALFTSSGIMGDVMPFTDLLLFLMSGSFLRLASVPGWLHPVRYVSHFYYGMDAVSNIYWRQIKQIDCEANTTSLCVNDGYTVLSETGYSSSDFVLQDSLGLLLVVALWSILAFCGLRREQRKGYAY